jgi:hypothetical protein
MLWRQLMRKNTSSPPLNSTDAFSLTLSDFVLIGNSWLEDGVLGF